MKAIGIIAEYNPFHNGHLYHLNKIKEKYKDYAIVLVLSGNFTQRGDVSIIDKWKKSAIALKYGIDLVVELPFPFATQSADYFSYGAITILEKLQVERLIFGSESNDLETLETIVDIQINNEDFDKLVKIYSKLGNSYPKAISNAVNDLTGKTINTPNDLLGISYLKVIKTNKYKIIPETIKRKNNYHNNCLEEKSSATALRHALKNNENIKNYVPDKVLPYINNLHFIDDYFNYIKYKILTEKDLSIYQTVDDSIKSTLKDTILKVSSYQELIDNLKSKRYTQNKITRMLLHILCNFTKEDAKNFSKISYIRILGFSESGKKYLNEIKKDIDIPLISKISKNKDPMLNFEIKTTAIYSLIDKENLVDKEYKNIIATINELNKYK